MSTHNQPGSEQEMFARVLSHDVASLIRSARQLSAYTREDILREDADSAMHALGMLDVRLAHLDRFFVDLIRYYRAGQRHGDVVQFSMTEILREAYSRVSMPASAQLRLSCEVDMVVADITLLRTVLHELFENTLKHHQDPGELIVSVEVAQGKDQRTMVTISDNGPGVAPSTGSRVLDPFFKVNSRAGSAGLGLSICKRELESAGGSIYVLPSADGFSVGITLPREASARYDERKPSIEPLRKGSTPELKLV
ncbi:MAG: HAMP domain-containing sensor histidine kinase [Pseudomonadota bacterium]